MSEEAPDTMDFDMVIVPFNSGTMEMRTMVVGGQPFVLIEPHEDEDGNVKMTVTASGLDDREGLESMLYLAHLGISEGTESEEE